MEGVSFHVDGLNQVLLAYLGTNTFPEANSKEEASDPKVSHLNRGDDVSVKTETLPDREDFLYRFD
eukprot:5002855-Amphidinium_carterae.1